MSFRTHQPRIIIILNAFEEYSQPMTQRFLSFGPRNIVSLCMMENAYLYQKLMCQCWQ